MEKRDDERLMARLTVRMQAEDGTSTIASTRNLSRYGAFINHQQGRVGQRFQLYVQNPQYRGAERRLMAEVTHVNDSGVGVRFVPALRSVAELLVRNGFGPPGVDSRRPAARNR